MVGYKKCVWRGTRKFQFMPTREESFSKKKMNLKFASHGKMKKGQDSKAKLLSVHGFPPPQRSPKKLMFVIEASDVPPVVTQLSNSAQAFARKCGSKRKLPNVYVTPVRVLPPVKPSKDFLSSLFYSPPGLCSSSTLLQHGQTCVGSFRRPSRRTLYSEQSCHMCTRTELIALRTFTTHDYFRSEARKSAASAVGCGGL